MDKLHAVLLWLEGKKSLFISIASVIISYLVTEGTISASLGTMLNALLATLTTGTVALGATQSYKAYKLGKSTPQA